MTVAPISREPAIDPEGIEVYVNAEPARLRPGSLADVLGQLGYGGAKVATALNGEFVPERSRATSPISPGDRIEILSARQGG
ncbi:MAG: sulfur carrier protein ThiS [Hyphomicrobiaceae bacterium]|nr:sulfur carrier protein ThiS [Hyphomicrobiaceae bacterium]